MDRKQMESKNRRAGAFYATPAKPSGRGVGLPNVVPHESVVREASERAKGMIRTRFERVGSGAEADTLHDALYVVCHELGTSVWDVVLRHWEAAYRAVPAERKAAIPRDAQVDELARRITELALREALAVVAAR